MFKKGIKANYYGESKFNGNTRGLQHAENTQEKSALRRYAKDQCDKKRSIHNGSYKKFQETSSQTRCWI